VGRPRRPAVRRASDRDGGFTLVEVVISLLLLSIVSAAALGLFLKSLGSGDLQVQRQQAVELANRELEQMRTLPARTLAGGRTQAEVDALWAAPGPVDTSQDVELWDPTANVSSVDVVPITQTEVVDHVSYTVSTFVDTCYLAVDGSSCGTTSGAGRGAVIRVAVGVTWGPGADRGCGTASGACGYVATTLVDPSLNPTFNTN
jgi:prepilin-type N-terminal cleavage/methylation domain-containing protein